MAITYSEALAILEASAKYFNTIHQTSEKVPTKSASGRIISQDVFSSAQTPAADTSAMDGYAVQSSLTFEASVETPFVMRVEGIVAAGAESVNGARSAEHASKRLRVNAENSHYYAKLPPCVEIMTGARFPRSYDSEGTSWRFDACVRLEDVQLLPSNSPDHTQVVQIVKPVKVGQNRRSAGEDFAKGDTVMQKGQTTGPQHLMALASLGIAEVDVFRRLTIAIISTGDEIVSADTCADDFHVRDANSPFLETVLQNLGMRTRNWGVIRDDASRFVEMVGKKAASEDIDIIVTTGAVSCGRYDFVEEALATLGGQTRFHRVAVRPGHPILFGDVPSRDRKCAFFGLPGNPMACVACFRFFVVPYLRFLHQTAPETTLSGRISRSSQPKSSGNIATASDEVVSAPSSLDIFRLGVQTHDLLGPCVKLIPNQGSHKIKPLLEADCWVLFPGTDVEFKAEDILNTVSLHPPSVGRI